MPNQDAGRADVSEPASKDPGHPPIPPGAEKWGFRDDSDVGYGWVWITIGWGEAILETLASDSPSFETRRRQMCACAAEAWRAEAERLKCEATVVNVFGGEPSDWDALEEQRVSAEENAEAWRKAANPKDGEATG